MIWPKVSRKGVIDRYYILRTPWFGIKVHRIHGSDDEWHTHPWNGFSIILGGYYEWIEKPLFKQPDDGPWNEAAVRQVMKYRRWFNRIYAHKRHKVTITKPVWTIFIHGKRRNESWQYGAATAPWRGPDLPS